MRGAAGADTKLLCRGPCTSGSTRGNVIAKKKEVEPSFSEESAEAGKGFKNRFGQADGLRKMCMLRKNCR